MAVQVVYEAAKDLFQSRRCHKQVTELSHVVPMLALGAVHCQPYVVLFAVGNAIIEDAKWTRESSKLEG